MDWRVSGPDRARWIALCAVGEVLGLAAGAIGYVWAERAFGQPEDVIQAIPLWFFLALAGLLEGAVIGSLQAFTLRRIYRALPIGLWINLTILMAILGWALGGAYNVYAPPAGTEGAQAHLALRLLAAAAFGALLGALFGAAQAMALDKAAHNGSRWIGYKAAGWALGMPVVVAAAAMSPAGASFATTAGIGLAAGVAAGLIVGMVTSLAFQGMPAREKPPGD